MTAQDLQTVTRQLRRAILPYLIGLVIAVAGMAITTYYKVQANAAKIDELEVKKADKELIETKIDDLQNDIDRLNRNIEKLNECLMKK